MRKSSIEADTSKSLLVSISEPKARRLVAKSAGLSSGALPVLSAIAWRDRKRLSTRPKTVYSAGIANEKLVREYLRELILAGFVRLDHYRGCRYLHITLEGLAVAAEYTRRIRAGALAFSQQ